MKVFPLLFVPSSLVFILLALLGIQQPIPDLVVHFIVAATIGYFLPLVPTASLCIVKEAFDMMVFIVAGDPSADVVHFLSLCAADFGVGLLAALIICRDSRLLNR